MFARPHILHLVLTWFFLLQMQPVLAGKPNASDSLDRDRRLEALSGTFIGFHKPFYRTAEDGQTILEYEVLGQEGSLQKADGRQSWKIIKPMVHYYGASGKGVPNSQNADMAADEGYWDTVTDEIRLIGNVQVTFQPGTLDETRGMTEALLWIPGQYLARTEEVVRIERVQGFIEGKGGEFDMQHGWMRIKDEVFGSLHERKVGEEAAQALVYDEKAFAEIKIHNQAVIFSCDGLFEYDFKKKTAQLFDNAILYHGTRQILADHMTLTLSGDGVESIQGNGHANIWVPDREIFSDNFFWHIPTDSGRFHGCPAVVKGSRGYFTGPVIRISNGNTRLLCNEGGVFKGKAPSFAH